MYNYNERPRATKTGSRILGIEWIPMDLKRQTTDSTFSFVACSNINVEWQ